MGPLLYIYIYICVHVYCQTLTPYLLQIELNLISSYITPSYLTIPPRLLYPTPPHYSEKPLLHHTPTQRGCCSSLPTRIKHRDGPFTQCYFHYYNYSSSHTPLRSLLLSIPIDAGKCGIRLAVSR